MNITLDIFKKLPPLIEENKIYDLSNAYFEGVKNRISDKSNSSETLINAIYNLELETIQKEFKLIRDQDYYYNVYIPYNKEAKKLWGQYCDLNKIDDFFERKQAMKKLKPTLLQYVTRFPNKYPIDPKKKDSYIVYEKDWEKYYDLRSGYRLDVKEDTLMFL